MPLGKRIAQALEAETQPQEQLRVARARLLERVTATPRRAPTTGKRLPYLGLAAIAALALALLLVRPWTRPISFATDAGHAAVGDVLEAPSRKPLQIEFSEGSRMLLHPGARARVLATQTAGARVLLESGVTDVSIVHRAHGVTRWSFEAGPFQVLVKGTQFRLDWRPESQALALTMKAGAVELSGACLTRRIVAHHDAVRVSCAKAPAPQPVAAQQAQPASTRAPEPLAPAKPLAAKGVRRSFEARCEAADKAELVAWANRERLAGRVQRARTALLVLRRRFPGSEEAGTAAFALGRMAFDKQADYRDAARWFEAYLAEQPRGPLMGDAAGRLLEAHERQGDRAAARRDAEAYLRRFPDGPYAGRAKRIIAE